MAPANRPRLLFCAAAGALTLVLTACGMGGPRPVGGGSSSEASEPVATPPVPRPAGNIYTVAPGDTIYVVARRFNVSVRSLIDANGLQAPFQLEPGQNLQLPLGGDYVVVKGDTLIKIARRAGVEFDTLARLNNLTPPYRLRIGQRLTLPTGATVQPAGATTEIGDTTVIQSPNAGGSANVAASAPTVPPGEPVPLKIEALPAPPPPPPKETVTFGDTTHVTTVTSPPSNDASLPMQKAPSKQQTVVAPNPGPSANPVGAARATVSPAPAPAPQLQSAAVTVPAARPPAAPSSRASLEWPVHGPIIEPFGTLAKGQHNDGINIAVPKGTPVLAAASGEVAYAGNELRGFGNLVLIKHTGTDLVTAYAHNEKLLVHQGEHVSAGQRIAISGDSGGVAEPQLHFEVRKGVHAIDPLTMLPPETNPASLPADRPNPG